MSHSSKTKSQQPVTTTLNNLQEHFTTLENTLKTLAVTLNQMSEEIMALQPLLLELTKTESEAEPENKPATKKPSAATSKKAPVAKKTTASASEKATANVEKSTTAASPTSPTFLEALNTFPIPELADKLKSAGTNQNVIKNIVRERKKIDFKEFTSLEDIISRIKGLARPSLDKILDQWS
jgi:chromosome segregation ATPase